MGGKYITGTNNVYCGIKGRYVHVVLSGTNYLHLCEVEVYTLDSALDIGSQNVLAFASVN